MSVLHQPDGMPEFLMGMPRASLEEAKQDAIERCGHDPAQQWAEPTPAHKDVIRGVLFVLVGPGSKTKTD